MDKNKLIETAAKHVAKGAYDKAIREYQEVLKADPRDVRVLQKMGELYQKKNDNSQAAHYFGKVAESYATDGFFLKAVALYKQVLKLNPSQVEVNIKLAELHQQLGLMSEALQYLQGVAAHHEQKGDARASLEVLQKMVELDPENAGSRMKLADLMARQDLKREAVVEFQRVAEQLKRANRTDDYLRVCERLCQLEPDNIGLNRELAVAYLERGDQKRALARLQVCFKAEPRNPDTLQLLARAFQGLGQTAKTISVYKELAKVFSDQGQASRAEAIWEQVRALDPDDPDWRARQRAAAPAPAAPARPAATQPAAAAPVRSEQQATPVASAAASSVPEPAAPQALGREQLAKLLQETDVYVKYGLHDKALEHLRKIFTVDPENLDAHEKAYQIYLAAEHAPQAAEQLLNVLRLCTRQRQVQRAQPYLQTLLSTQPHHVEVPAFLAVLGNGADAEPEYDEVVDDDDLLVVSADDDEIVVSDAPEDALLDDEEAFVSASDDEPLGEVGDDEPMGDEPFGDVAADPYDDGATVVLGLDGDVGLSVAADVIEEGEVVVSGEYLVEDDALVEDEALVDVDAAVFTGADDEVAFADEAATFDDGDDALYASVEPGLSLDVAAEEPALYAASGADDEAVVTSDDEVFTADDDDDALYAAAASADDEVLEVGGLHDAPAAGDWGSEEEPLGEEALAAIDDEPAAHTSEDAGFDPDASDFGASGPVADPAADEPAAEELDEAMFFMDQGLFEEARDILETVAIAYPGNLRALELMGQLEALEAQGAAGDQEASVAAPPHVGAMQDDLSAPEADAFDLAQELADDFDAAQDAIPEAGGEDFQYSVEEVFSAFKKGLEQVVRPEDVDTHYDLGIAYKEMGLLDDAISEFNVARNGCLGQKKELDCLTMVGMLELMRGNPGAAVEAYREALQTPFAEGPTEVALRFELGGAHEAAGSPGRALHYYQQVARLDPGFRQVGDQVARLATFATPEPDAPMQAAPSDQARARKVGYL